MSHLAVNVDALASAIGELGPVFNTKDVSEHAGVRDAHPDLSNHSHYHAFIGKALMLHHVQLGIVHGGEAKPRGARWTRERLELAVPLVSEPDPAVAPLSDPSSPNGLGPQYSGDSTFQARMRHHQSWYRANVLGLPYGAGPGAAGRPLGNMLTPADGAAGRNFLDGEIASLATARLAEGTGTIDRYRLMHNMLSSQPMCFNLFGPLASDLEFATQLLAPVVPDGVSQVTRVAFEWAPKPAAEYLGDRTAFDAFIEYRTNDGRLCAVGIETKLTEPFSQQNYDGELYRRWMRSNTTTWRDGVSDRVQAIGHNQLWRDHLLAMALRHHPASPYANVRLLLVHHPGDSDCAAIHGGYRALLQEQCDSLQVMALDELIAKWSERATTAKQRGWLRSFRTRYLDLHLSETARTPKGGA
jgi:hypothetical protein